MEWNGELAKEYGKFCRGFLGEIHFLPSLSIAKTAEQLIRQLMSICAVLLVISQQVIKQFRKAIYHLKAINALLKVAILIV
jgi:hypothetical protein